MRKKIIIKSHCLPKEQIIELINGDKFDSVIELYNENKLINFWKCNVDSSNNRKDGKVEISPGEYMGKVILSDKLGKSILIMTRKGSIILPSIYPNPRHNNKYVCSSIMIHKTKGIYWDGSEGCITIPVNYFNDFINHFTIGEIVDIAKV